MMTKYYRVIKANPLWEVGAILKYDSAQGNKGGYTPIEDIWDVLGEHQSGEYLSKNFIEMEPEFFERVYKSDLDKVVYYTKEEFKKLYEKFKK